MVAYSTCLISSEITWEPARPAVERDAVQAALTHPSLLDTTLTRLYAEAGMHPASVHLTVRYLATGGAKRVYLVTAHTQTGGAYAFVLKQFIPVQLAHLPPGASVAGAQANAEDLDTRLLEHM